MSNYDIKATAFVFVHEKLTPIIGKPDHSSITTIKKQVYANAYNNPCNLGGGDFGYLGLIMTANKYAEQFPSGNPVIPFAKPGALDATATDEEKKAHAQQLLDLRTMDALLKKQVLAAIDHIYLSSIENDLTGFATCTTKDILEHITKQYDIIDYDALQANRELLDAPWNFTEPIHMLWTRINNCKRFATAGKSEIDDMTAMQATYKVLKQTGVFATHVVIWKQKPENEWDLDEFKKFFDEADRERIAMTAKEAGYTGNKPSEKTSYANAVTNGTTAKSTSNENESTGTNTTTKASPKFLMFGDKKIWYCWSHGGSLSQQHTSMTCTNPLPGHVKHATWINMCGGCGDHIWAKQNKYFKKKGTETESTGN
jgi:hypothetical protein